MGEGKAEVWQGTLALMVLTTLDALGEQHGYGIARRIEQTSGDRLSVNPGTLYPTLLKLEQEGYIESRWGVSDNNRRARFYRLTRAGRHQIQHEREQWELANDIMARFLSRGEGAMRRLRALLLRIAGLFGRSRSDADIEDELQAHVETARGGSSPRRPATARRRERLARAACGSLTAAGEAYRERRGLPAIETLWRDVRYGVRVLAKTPGFTARRDDLARARHRRQHHDLSAARRGELPRPAGCRCHTSSSRFVRSATAAGAGRRAAIARSARRSGGSFAISRRRSRACSRLVTRDSTSRRAAKFATSKGCGCPAASSPCSESGPSSDGCSRPRRIVPAAATSAR